MKVFLRTLVILFASLIVVGAAYGISSLSGSSNTSGTEAESSRPTPPEGFQRPEGGEGEEGGQSFSLMGLGSVGMEAGKIALIVAPFAIAAGVKERRKQSRKVTVAA